MKRTLLWCLFLPMLPLAVSASEKIDGIYYNLDPDAKTAEVVFHQGYNYSGDVVIPSSITHDGVDYIVTGIAERAFYECSDLTSVVIPNSLTTIGKDAFRNCYKLTKIELNSNAIVSKNYTLDSPQLSRVFGTQVKEYILGEEVTGIGDNAFFDSSIASINIPEKVTRIGDNAFNQCGSLTSISIPKNVASIGVGAFQACGGLNSIQVESGNSVYDSREDCNAIIETASNTLIQGCVNTTIPSSVTAIGDIAFYKCRFSSITIPNSVKTIGNSAFAGCSSLTSIDIPYGVTKIGKNAFCCKSLTSVTIPNSVTDIGELAFQGCSKLPSITIPSSVKNIGSRIFFGCSGLTSLQVESGNTVYDSRENCNAIIESASNTLIAGCRNTVIPSGVTSIGDFAFCECSELTAITIPSSVTYIGGSAFQRCYKLSSISIPDGVSTIGDYAFANCWELSTVVIPKSMKSIGNRAFIETMILRELYCYAEQVPETGNEIFDYSHRGATLHVPAASVSAYQAVEPWKNFKEIVALPALADYRPFVEEGKVWKVGGIGTGNPVLLVRHFYFDGDTVIDGRTCKQMMRQRYENPNINDVLDPNAFSAWGLVIHSSWGPLKYEGAWYEEDKKVYKYNPEQKQFELMYDFSVNANDTLWINDIPYVVGPRQTGGITGYKGVFRDVWMCGDGDSLYRSTPWLEGVGGIYDPTINVFDGQLADPMWFLMSCTVGDEVIYFNDEYEDGTTPEEARKRIDFTHTIKTKPKAPRKREKSDARISSSEREVPRPEVKAPRNEGEETMQTLYGEYSSLKLDINLNPLDDAYQVRITDETGKAVYEKNVNAASIVGLNIDISAYAAGRYTVTVENSSESFTGIFETVTTGIEEIQAGTEACSGWHEACPYTGIYNLQGQRISSLQKGLNIVNGQKVIVQKSIK